MAKGNKSLTTQSVKIFCCWNCCNILITGGSGEESQEATYTLTMVGKASQPTLWFQTLSTLQNHKQVAN